MDLNYPRVRVLLWPASSQRCSASYVSTWLARRCRLKQELSLPLIREEFTDIECWFARDSGDGTQVIWLGFELAALDGILLMHAQFTSENLD